MRSSATLPLMRFMICGAIQCGNQVTCIAVRYAVRYMGQQVGNRVLPSRCSCCLPQHVLVLLDNLQ